MAETNESKTCSGRATPARHVFLHDGKSSWNLKRKKGPEKKEPGAFWGSLGAFWRDPGFWIFFLFCQKGSRALQPSIFFEPQVNFVVNSVLCSSKKVEQHQPRRTGSPRRKANQYLKLKWQKGAEDFFVALGGFWRNPEFSIYPLFYQKGSCPLLPEAFGIRFSRRPGFPARLRRRPARPGRRLFRASSQLQRRPGRSPFFSRPSRTSCRRAI